MLDATLSSHPVGISANKLLASVSRDSAKHIAAGMEEVTLTSKQVLYQPGERITSVYFPTTAVVAHLTLMSDGHQIDSGTVGCEGATWITAVGVPMMPCQTITAVAGRAIKVPLEMLRRVINEDQQFRERLMRYEHALLVHSMRSTACNGLHSVHQRTTRWLLSTLDRVQGSSFSVTQEFLAQLLGVGRPRISEVVGHFEGMGLLKVRRGEITVADRAGLEKYTCECYHIIRETFESSERAAA